HMCLAIPAKLFKDIGWENPDIISGTDPDLRHRVREAGLRVCVVPQCWAYHPMPENFSKLIKLAFIKGKNSALTRKTHPHLVLDLDAGNRKSFPAKRGFVYRIARFCVSILKSLICMRLYFASYLISYAVGNLCVFLGRPGNKNTNINLKTS
ncbi:MAG TPA: hypothetical protein PK821_06500, partial [Victivallales bacterium]|nr:hypothetical protein [Victivallales bacterium]